MNRQIAVGFLTVALLAACGPKEKAEEKSVSRDVSPGKGYFVGFGCTRCHRVGPEGGDVGPDLTFVGFRKSREWIDQWLRNPPAWKKDTIMPVFYLKVSIREALVDYLASLKGQDFGPTSHPWNTRDLLDDPVKRGEVIFNRAGCVGCHGVKGVGGYPNNNVYGGKIPTLTYAADGYTKEELTEKIRLGVKPAKKDPNGPDPLIFMPPWGEVLQENEIQALVEYLFSLRPPRPPEDEWDM